MDTSDNTVGAAVDALINGLVTAPFEVMGIFFNAAIHPLDDSAGSLDNPIPTITDSIASGVGNAVSSFLPSSSTVIEVAIFIIVLLFLVLLILGKLEAL